MSCFGSWEDLLLSLCFTGKISADDDNVKKGEKGGSCSPAPVLSKNGDTIGSSKNGNKVLFKRKKKRNLRFLFRSSKVDDASSNEKNSSETAASAVEDLSGVTTTTTTIRNADEMELRRRFPASTLNERKRFLTMRSLARATEKMNFYMNWRRQYHLDSPSFRDHPMFRTDLDSWNFAVAHSSRYFHDGLRYIQRLPRIVKFGDESGLIASDGKRIAHVLPGLIDKDIAPLEFYALCVAVYMDLKFDRNSDESVYVFIDVRAGDNWPNPPPSSLVPFVKSLTKNLSDTMPERMCKTIVYPIPSYAKPVWIIYKTFLEPRQVQKIDVLWGPASVDSYIPKEMSRKSFCGYDIVRKLEQSRQREFYPDLVQ